MDDGGVGHGGTAGDVVLLIQERDLTLIAGQVSGQESAADAGADDQDIVHDVFSFLILFHEGGALWQGFAEASQEQKKSKGNKHQWFIPLLSVSHGILTYPEYSMAARETQAEIVSEETQSCSKKIQKGRSGLETPVQAGKRQIRNVWILKNSDV